MARRKKRVMSRVRRQNKDPEELLVLQVSGASQRAGRGLPAGL